MKPVEIIGGGLAGLMLGILLRLRGVPVTVHEAGSYPRHRVCGEFICGAGAEVLRASGLEEALDGAVAHRDVRWFLRDRVVYASALPVPAIGVSRHRLDARMAEAFTGLGGELRLRSRVSPDEKREGRVLCCGRRLEGSRWLGLKLHCTGLASAEGLELHLGRGGYAGVSAVEDGRSNVCGLFRLRPGLRAPRTELLVRYLEAAGMDGLARRVAGGGVDPTSVCGVSGIRFSTTPAPGVRVGDNHAMVPPFTGNGMSIALEGAAAAVDPLAGWARGELSWDEAGGGIRRGLERRFGRRLKVAGALHPFLLAGAGQQFLGLLARTRLLPFRTLYTLTHAESA